MPLHGTVTENYLFIISRYYHYLNIEQEISIDEVLNRSNLSLLLK